MKQTGDPTWDAPPPVDPWLAEAHVLIGRAVEDAGGTLHMNPQAVADGLRRAYEEGQRDGTPCDCGRPRALGPCTGYCDRED